LTNEIYDAFEKNRDFDFRSQIQSAAVSVMNNFTSRSFLQNPLKSGIFTFHPLCGGCGFRFQSDKVEFVAIQ